MITGIDPKTALKILLTTLAIPLDTIYFKVCETYGLKPKICLSDKLCKSLNKHASRKRTLTKAHFFSLQQRLLRLHQKRLKHR